MYYKTKYFSTSGDSVWVAGSFYIRRKHIYLPLAMGGLIGVSIAWFINVKLLPYPPKPGSLSHWLTEKSRVKKKEH